MSPDDGSSRQPISADHALTFAFKDIVDQASDIVVVTKAWPLGPIGPIIVYVNEAFSRVTGYAPAEVIGGNPRRLQSDATDGATKKRIREALAAGRPVRATLLNKAKDGRLYWVELNIVPLRDAAGEVTHFAAIERDITEQKRLESELAAQARTDGLTGLLNRRAFLELAEAEVSRLRRHGGMAALAMLDIDRFKAINDGFGHAAGDAVLRALAQHCRQSLRTHDAIGRVGGEEFAMLLPEMGMDAAAEVAERLRLGLAQLVVPAGNADLGFTVSIGVALLSPTGDDLAAALARADAALYRAKHEGRNRVARAMPDPSA